MATGSIRELTTKGGKKRFQITIEGERDPLTGKRNRTYKNVTGSLRETKSVMHKMITEMEQNMITTHVLPEMDIDAAAKLDSIMLKRA